METKTLALDFTYALQAGQAVQQVMQGAPACPDCKPLADELRQG